MSGKRNSRGSNPSSQLDDAIQRIAAQTVSSGEVERVTDEISSWPAILDEQANGNERSIDMLTTTTREAFGNTMVNQADQRSNKAKNIDFGKKGRMWSWISFGGIAAAITLVVLLILPTTESSLFAKMQEAVKKKNTIKLKASAYRPGQDKPWKTSKWYVEGEQRVREERHSESLGGDAVSVFDLKKSRYATWSPLNNRAVVGKIGDSIQMRKQIDFGLTALTEFDPAKATSKATRKDGGREVVIYELQSSMPHQESTPMEVVVDKETALPVKITYFDNDGNVTLVHSEIEFNVELDEGLFSTTPPTGYEIIERDMDGGQRY